MEDDGSIAYIQWHGCSWPDFLRSQGISSYGIDLALAEHCGSGIRRVNHMYYWLNIMASRRHIQIDGLVQTCSISIVNTLEILQSCTNPLKCFFFQIKICCPSQQSWEGYNRTTKCVCVHPPTCGGLSVLIPLNRNRYYHLSHQFSFSDNPVLYHSQIPSSL